MESNVPVSNRNFGESFHFRNRMVAHDLERLVAGRIREMPIPMILFGGHSPTSVRAHVPLASPRVLRDLGLLQEHQGS